MSCSENSTSSAVATRGVVVDDQDGGHGLVGIGITCPSRRLAYTVRVATAGGTAAARARRAEHRELARAAHSTSAPTGR